MRLIWISHRPAGFPLTPICARFGFIVLFSGISGGVAGASISPELPPPITSIALLRYRGCCRVEQSFLPYQTRPGWHVYSRRMQRQGRMRSHTAYSNVHGSFVNAAYTGFVATPGEASGTFYLGQPSFIPLASPWACRVCFAVCCQSEATALT